jgi:CIC family chloride channel protein
MKNNGGIMILALGLLVGIAGGLGSIIFHEFIKFTTLAFYGDTSGGFLALIETIPWWQRVLIPTLGGLLVGITFKLARVSEAEGEGVPEVMEALAHKRGTIRPIVAPVKIIAAALTLGSGGSAGREGPVIQIGSAIGSSIAQFFKQAPRERSLLLAAGAAAGIGGTFGAPMAGVLFTVEILRHRPRLLQIFVLIVAAFTGTILVRLISGEVGLRFAGAESLTLSATLVTSMIVVSIVATFAALCFGRTLSLGRTLFKKISLPHILKPALGGLMIGLVGLLLPHIHEPAAYPLMVDLISVSSLSLSFLLTLLIIKMVATSITLGSGGAGGIFAPLLLMGAITGSAIGSIVVLTTFGSPAMIPLLIVVGMATMFAAAAHAPLTAAFITYELTGNLALLPLLVVLCLIASALSKRLQKESVYEHSTLEITK